MNARPFVPIVLSAVAFGLSIPLSKLLLKDIPPVSMAGLLYVGAFSGLSLYAVARRVFARGRRADTRRRFDPLRAGDLPWLAGAIVFGGVVGPVCLMEGLRKTSGSSASLLLNLEGLATALLAVLLFREPAGRRTWTALAAMTAAGVLTSWDPVSGRIEVLGPLLVFAAMMCWGLDNNLTRNISDKDPVLVARIKGFVAGAFSLGLAAAAGERVPIGFPAALALVVGAVCYGFSLVLFIESLKRLGAFRTAAFFGLAPFVGAAIALPVLGEPVHWTLGPAAALMTFGVFLIAGEKHAHAHTHRPLTHSHSHIHRELHHNHSHPESPEEPHGHEHDHPDMEHVHGHWPDGHHRHRHKVQ
jgi:drug/metabolite transporter (DMT)-like permease